MRDSHIEVAWDPSIARYEVRYVSGDTLLSSIGTYETLGEAEVAATLYAIKLDVYAYVVDTFAGEKTARKL